jgi:hypothetical protein
MFEYSGRCHEMRQALLSASGQRKNHGSSKAIPRPLLVWLYIGGAETAAQKFIKQDVSLHHFGASRA